MRLPLYVMVLFLSAGLCCFLYAQEKTVIGVDEENPPFMFQDSSSGTASGLYPVIIRAVCGRAGLPVVIKTYPWKRALLMGEQGESGIGGIYKNEQRLPVFDYSDQLFTEKLIIYTRKGESLNFRDILSLKGRKISAIRGWSYGDAFDKAKAEGLFFVDDSPSDAAGFKKLLIRKEIDCVIAVEESGERTIQKLGIRDRVRREDQPLSVSPTFIAFAKKMQKSEFIGVFNRTLRDMKSDGTYQASVNDAFR